ncbi:MAG: type II toxin-antitoxin system HipA family toxin [Candidatus Competibacteraceae bacterium]|nr:type II toxin-antitoxin system HipA family toxin [Candidatus Competibacteraceae bacterium]
MRTTGSDTLSITLNQRRIGTITRLINDTIVFAFDPEYEQDNDRPILSLSYKGALNTLVPGKTTTTSKLTPLFSNLLPEGHLREYLAKSLDISSNREFYLLAALGQDLPGAVIATPLGEIASSDFSSPQRNKIDIPELRFSLAGVQLKFSAIAEARGTFTVTADGGGGSWIIKLPSANHPQVPEVEYSMLTLAKLTGIEVPEFKLIQTSLVEGLPAEFRSIVAESLAVKRFDRTDNGGRIHMEDFRPGLSEFIPKDKYAKAGFGHIARVLWLECGEESYCEFIRRLVFSVAIGNGGHASEKLEPSLQRPKETSTFSCI